MKTGFGEGFPIHGDQKFAGVFCRIFSTLLFISGVISISSGHGRLWTSA